jgi:hypothetical protein
MEIESLYNVRRVAVRASSPSFYVGVAWLGHAERDSAPELSLD